MRFMLRALLARYNGFHPRGRVVTWVRVRARGVRCASKCVATRAYSFAEKEEK